MPNWCQNTVTLRHPDPAMILRVAESFSRGELLNEFIPVPADLKDTTSGYLGDNDAQAALEARQRQNIEKYGFPTWYEFCIYSWGCKWDIEGEIISQNDHTIVLNFDSAWSPPIEAYRVFSELGFGVVALYYEPGMSFCGEYTTEADDFSYTIVGDSDWVVENIPPHIDNEFAISQNMSDWESEEEYEMSQVPDMLDDKNG